MSDKLKKDYKDDKKMDKKDTKERDMKRAAIIRAVQNHPIIWKSNLSYKDKDHKDKKDKDHKDKKDKDKDHKDKKYKDHSQSHGGLSQAWNLVAAETNIPEKDAEKTWSKLVKEFESNYDDIHYYGIHGNLSASASTGTTMECDKCKFWKPMNFYKEYLDSQKFPNMQRSAAPAPVHYPPQSNLIHSGMGINAPPLNSVVVDRNFGWVVNETNTNPAGSSVPYTNSLTLGDAHREIDAGLMTKEKFLQYLGNILNSVPIAHLGNCEKRLLEVAVGSALS